MMRRTRIPNLGGATALVLHRPHASVDTLTRQLGAIGLVAQAVWPELPAEALAADFVFFDADMGHDEQFPWNAGEAPMPTIALIGSEAPGRIEWALRQGADSHLVKPVGSAGIYSALLIARKGFEARRELLGEIAVLRERVAERRTIVKAVAKLASTGIDEDQAYAQLRALAMSWRMTMEDAAGQVLHLDQGGRDERSARV